MDCSPPGSSVLEILQARILKSVAIPFSRESSWPRARTRVSCITGRVFTIWATREAHKYVYIYVLLLISWLLILILKDSILVFCFLLDTWSKHFKYSMLDNHVYISYHHGLDGHESEWTPRVGDGQGGLACCDSWGLKELDTTEWLNWTELNWWLYIKLPQNLVASSSTHLFSHSFWGQESMYSLAGCFWLRVSHMFAKQGMG